MRRAAGSNARTHNAFVGVRIDFRIVPYGLLVGHHVQAWIRTGASLLVPRGNGGPGRTSFACPPFHRSVLVHASKIPLPSFFASLASRWTFYHHIFLPSCPICAQRALKAGH
eukprot:scaffold2859_cov349-Pavlova_lutheri.AAC.9